MSKKRNKNSRKKQLKARKLKKNTTRKIRRNILDTLEYNITKEPIDDSDVRGLPENIQDKIEDIYDRVQLKPISTIQELKLLIKEYPHISQLYNYLYAAYANTGQSRKAIKIMKENYKINPTYLFAILNYAEHFINIGKLKIATDVLGDKFDLKSLYPERNTFHETEVISFYGVIGYYFIKNNQREEARSCLEILEAVSSVHYYTQRLREMLSTTDEFIA